MLVSCFVFCFWWLQLVLFTKSWYMLIYNLIFKQSPLSSVFSKICQPNPGLPLTHHRRVASSFKDPSLFQIFQISLTSLRQLKNHGNMRGFWWFWPFENAMHLTCFLIHILILFSPSLVFPSYVAVSSMLKQLAVSLSLRCLSYDFVGTSQDESSEEFGTVQVSPLKFNL